MKLDRGEHNSDWIVTWLEPVRQSGQQQEMTFVQPNKSEQDESQSHHETQPDNSCWPKDSA